MSAVALDIDFLSPEVHREIHEVIRQERNLAWANVVVGEAKQKIEIESGFDMEPDFGGLDSSSSQTEVISMDDTSFSLEQESCVKCGRRLEGVEQQESLYEYENGDPAFYLCIHCESNDGFDSQ